MAYLTELFAQISKEKVYMNVYPESLPKRVTVNPISTSWSHLKYFLSSTGCKEEKKPHNCDICGKKFVSKSELERHYHVHTGEKTMICGVCAKILYCTHGGGQETV
jgi:uncharacterized Zn-finger protein